MCAQGYFQAPSHNITRDRPTRLLKHNMVASHAQQHGTNETRNTLNTNLNTNLMQGHRDSSVSPCSLPEITEHRIFLHFILLRANQRKRYYILYITIMFKHLKVIFLHFGLKNRNRLSEYEFYS